MNCCVRILGWQKQRGNDRRPRANYFTETKQEALNEDVLCWRYILDTPWYQQLSRQNSLTHDDDSVGEHARRGLEVLEDGSQRRTGVAQGTPA